MELVQRVEIPLGVERVWQALNDANVLKTCLRGCEVFEKVSENEFSIVLQASVGPVKARFRGAVRLSEVNPPSSYILSGEGKGGVAGFAKGAAKVELRAIPGEGDDRTCMTYTVTANVGGKLAQLGARLVNGAARKMADDFFRQFVRTVCDDPEGKLEISLETVQEN